MKFHSMVDLHRMRLLLISQIINNIIETVGYDTSLYEASFIPTESNFYSNLNYNLNPNLLPNLILQ